MRLLSARAASSSNAGSRRQHRDLARMDRAAHGHRAAPHRGRGRDHLDARPQGGSGRARRCRPEGRRHRPHRLRDLDPGPHLPVDRDADPGRLGIHHGAAFDLQAVCTGFVYAVATADKFLTSGSHKPRPGHRRRDLLAHPRLERPHHLRAVRRRRRRDRARGGGGRGHLRRPRRPHRAPALRRALPRQALRRRRSGLDRHHRRSQDGRARGVPLRRRHDHRRDPGCVRRHRHHRRGSRLVRAAPGQQAHHRRRAPTSSASRAKRW